MDFTREEEILARDACRALYQQWNLAVFQRIAGSEHRHLDAIGGALLRRGIDDPGKDGWPGVSLNPDLNRLYTEMMTKGAVSGQDALQVGLLIERKDIGDLEKALKDTPKTDL